MEDREYQLLIRQQMPYQPECCNLNYLFITLKKHKIQAISK